MLNWNRLLPLFAIAALALFAVACSGDDDSEPPDGGATGSEPAASGATGASSGPGAPEDGGPAIKLGFSAWPGWFPWQVAEEKGFFAQAGVDVELVWFEGYLDSINAFAAGQLDANTQTLNDTLASVAAGSDQRIVLVNDNSTGNDQIIVSEGITSIQDLAGKSIGIEVGVVDHFLLALGLEDAGMSLEDVNITALETGAAAAAFSAGQLEAVGAFAPFTTQALTREGSHVLFDSADFPGAIPDHLVVSGALVDERPDVVQGLIDAWYLTMAFLETNPDEAIEIMAKRAGVTIEEYREYDAGTTLFSIDDNIEAFAAGNDITHLSYAADEIAAFLVEVGFVEGEFDYSRMLEPRFVEAYKAANP
jgi:NitT/TauT family transport system substrate-binding protein